ncbi:MAG: RNA polymerase sigma factor [Firmicutes bacterium]|nr:RNA polymerase sigma factor [Bacillota bacterium]
MTDVELVRAILAGRKDLFALVVERHADLVHAVVRSFLGGDHEAEDAIQEIFLKAYRSLGQYRGEASLATWLYRIALNHLKDRVRQRGLRTIPFGSPTAFPAQGLFPDPQEELAASEQRLLLQEALAELPAIYRRVIFLYHYHGLSYAEIGARLRISPRSVETRLYRAKRMLRAKLALREVSTECTVE